MAFSFNVSNYVDAKSVLEFTKELVRAQSITGEEKRGAEFMANAMEALGLKVQIDEVEPGRSNVVGILKGEEGSPILILNGHVDTVPPGDRNLWKVDPFSAEEIEGRIYGRGSADMKGGLASMLGAIKAIKESGLRLRGDLVFQAVIDEERGGHKGTKRLLLEKGIVGDYAIVGEPTNLDIQIAHKGDLGVEIITMGKAAHAATPQEGINAIQKMNAVMNELLSIHQWFNWERKRHKLVGTPTINLSVINGGLQRNMVPDFCQLVVDRRVVPGLETLEDAKKEIEFVLKGAMEKDPQLRLKMRTILEIEAAEVPRDEKIVEVLIGAYEKALRKKPVISGLVAFSDMHWLTNQSAIPTVMLGPGRVEEAHKTNEYVKIHQLIDAAKVYTQVIADLLGFV